MIRKRLPLLALAALCGVVLAMLACSTLNARLAPTATPVGVWTPAPMDTANVPIVPTPTDAPLPTPAPTEAAAADNGPTPTPFRAAPEGSASDNAAPAATALPTGPKTVTVTDAEIAQSIATGVVGQNGVGATNLQVHFTGGKVRITADTLTYGFVSVNNLVLVGHLVAQDGVMQLETESISPGGLVTAMIPPLVNQALKNYGSQWYVEDVVTSEGQMQLTIR